MLEVHAPHESVHTWKGFFIHIATIVVGLFIAVALEQTVEYFHHRHLVDESRESLRIEREENIKRIAENADLWRRGAAQLRNNLVVLQYLQQHPGTPREKLPGVLLWTLSYNPHIHSSWDAVQQTGVAALMPHKETAVYAEIYRYLDNIDAKEEGVWNALNAAQRFNLLDSNPSQMTSAVLAETISLTETALTQHILLGTAIENIGVDFPEFTHTLTLDEIHQLRNPPDAHTQALLTHAQALTENRLRAAGWKPELATAPKGNVLNLISPK